jgi:hypothetical protein
MAPAMGPFSVASADFNGDGKPDIAVANYNSNNVSILLGNGNGTFQTAVNYGVANGPFTVVVGDINGDGKADVITSNQKQQQCQRITGERQWNIPIGSEYDRGQRSDLHCCFGLQWRWQS